MLIAIKNTMKKLLLILFSLCTALLSAQSENSLLWKISGNGLEKDSYLFGTMHVSERIAFHLDDIFYESLINADYIALESNPEKWLDYSFESGDLSLLFTRSNSGTNFYNKAFQFQIPKLTEMGLFLSQENRLLNGILYRTNPMTQDFQEETYLDMFIFQTGNKYGKTVVGLEDIKRSSDLVKKAVEGRIQKNSPDLWLQKLMKEKSFPNLMSDSYRDRNISFLDSLNKGIYNEKYMKNMLYIRNEDMVKGIDSLAQLGSTFSAVGAAHLAGEEGVIQKLIDRGYTVTPLLSEKTEKGDQIKKEIERKEADIHYEKKVSKDGFFAINSTSTLYEISTNEFTLYISPNIRNGAYHTIARINRMNNFGGDIESLEGIDRILFESIPGNIISKTEITKGGFKGLDIVNKTKIGDYQRYQIFMTPIEVFIFKMAGKRDYVITKGDEFFDSLEFLKVSDELVTVAPKYKGFQITLPKSHSIHNNDEYGNRLIQATDTEGNYYFLKEVALNDVEYLEEDDFELKRIHERFYKNAKSTFGEGDFSGSGGKRTYVSKSKKSESDTYMHLKTMIRGGHYYLIGKVGPDSSTPKNYFDSFQLTPFQYDESDFEVRKDTSLYYSVNTIVDPSYGYQNKNEKKKDYESYSRKASFKTNTNEEVKVELQKFHDWKYLENIDSLWNEETEKFDIKKRLLNFDFSGDYEFLESILNSKPLRIKQKKVGKDKFGNESLTFYLRDSLSDRAVKVKKVYTQGKLYTIETLVDTRFEESKFVQDFYESFQPEIDPENTVDLFKNKVDLLVDAIKKGDSIVLKSISKVKFGKQHQQLLMDLFRDKTIPKNQEFIKAYVLSELSEIESKRVDEFLEEVYNESFYNPINQMTIFNSVAKKKNKASYKKLLQLLEIDVPISNSPSDVQRMFNKMNDSLELAKSMYPKLLTYTAIESYKKPVYALLVELLEKDLVKPSIYKRYFNRILTEARIEIKKELSSTLDKSDQSYSSSSYSRSYLSRTNRKKLLQLYVKLLVPYANRKGTQELLDKITLIDNIAMKTTYITEMAKAKRSIDPKVVQEIVKDYKGHFELFKELQKIDRLDVLPKSYREKDSVYKAYILDGKDLTEKDSVAFVGRREFTHKKHEFEVYFYKVKKEAEYEYSRSKWKMSYAIFRKEKGKIYTRSAYSAYNKYIDETEPIENQLDLYIEKFKLKNRQRVVLSVEDKGGYGLY